MDQLVSGLVEGLPDKARAALVARAEGIPLYAVETVRTLIDREIVRPEGGRYVVAPGATVDLADVVAPPSLHALVASRLDALTPDERRVIADASVLGLTFPRDGLEFLCKDLASLEDVLASLQRKELLGTDNDRFSAERGHYRFVQAVVRQVAYSTLSRRARKERHLAVATHLQATTEVQSDLSMVAAQHLIDAVAAAGPDDPDVPDLDRRAAELLLVAGERASRLGSYAAAVAAFRDAATRLDADLERARALLRAARAADLMMDPAATLELAPAAQELLAELNLVVEAAQAAHWVARAQSQLGQTPEALETARSAWEALRGTTGAEGVQAQLALTMATNMNRLEADPKEIVWFHAEGLRLAEASGDPHIVLSAMGNFATYQTARGSSRVSNALMREVVDLARTLGAWTVLGTNLLGQSLLTRLRDLPEALQLVEESVSMARQHGLVAVVDRVQPGDLSVGHRWLVCP